MSRALSVTAILLSLVAFAQGAQASDCVYVNSEPDYRGGEPRPQRTEVRIEDRVLYVNSGGHVTEFNDETGGTGVAFRIARSEDLQRAFPYWFVDLKGVSKEGAPDHVLIFGTDTYWPECK